MPCAVLLAPTVASLQDGRATVSKMPPRRQLLRLWLAMRFLVFGAACILAGFVLAYGLWHGWDRVYHDPLLHGCVAAAAVTLPSPFLFTPSFRGRVHRWLGAIGKSGSQQQEAATVALLIGGQESGCLARAMKTASEHFLVLPLASLTAADLTSNADTGLNARVKHAALGDCEAFMSHSWRDDGDQKFARLHEHQWGTPEPTIWLDKACIDQGNIDASLAVLPSLYAGLEPATGLAAAATRGPSATRPTAWLLMPRVRVAQPKSS
jgi:hypothetical protein